MADAIHGGGLGHSLDADVKDDEELLAQIRANPDAPFAELVTLEVQQSSIEDAGAIALAVQHRLSRLIGLGD